MPRFFFILSWIAVFAVFCYIPATGGPDQPTVEPAEIVHCPQTAFETLHYEFGWNGIAAADARVYITHKMLEDDPVIHLTADARTIGLARKLWKMDDRIEAFVHPETLKPFKVEIHREEAGKTYKTNILFMQEKRIAHVTDIKGKRVRKREIKYDRVYDPLTLILLVRCLDLKVGRKIAFDVLERKRVYRVILDVLKEENIKVKAGNFHAYKIQPRIYRITRRGKVKKEFSKEVKEVYIWVAKGPQKYLLKVKSKVFVGSVYGELIKVEKK